MDKNELNVYKMEDKDDECKEDIDNVFEKCLCVKRICMALKYYSLLNIIKNKKHQNVFNKFINDIYPNILEDKTHLMQKHSHQIENIYESLIQNNIFTKYVITY